TVSDVVNAAKTPEPLVAHPGSLGNLVGQDVLVVDDIAGTGDTLTAARTLLVERNPSRVRTGVLWLNVANWQFAHPEPTYVGERDRGWVVFPWET
ncbi:MAG: phosphoribosyltransferase, partial [Pseudonocardiaceae bacterium]